jgi:hypothetical protein
MSRVAEARWRSTSTRGFEPASLEECPGEGDSASDGARRHQSTAHFACHGARSPLPFTCVRGGQRAIKAQRDEVLAMLERWLGVAQPQARRVDGARAICSEAVSGRTPPVT